MDTVLHIHDPDEKLDAFTLVNLMHTTQGRVILHISREAGYDFVTIGSRGIESQITGGEHCGCP